MLEVNEIMKNVAMEKFKEYQAMCYGEITVEQEKPKQNIFNELIEDKPKRQYEPLFPLSFYKNGHRLSARYNDFHICNCDKKDKLNVQKDFDGLKKKGMGLMQIRKELRPKYNKIIRKKHNDDQLEFEFVPKKDEAYFGVTRRKNGGVQIQKTINGKTQAICQIREEYEYKADFVRYYLQQNYNPKYNRDDYRRLLKDNMNFDFIIMNEPKKPTPKKQVKAVAPKKEVTDEWSKLTWNERAHLLNDGVDTKIFASDFLDICSIMANGGNGRALASHFNNVEFGTLMLLGENYNTPRFNELYNQGKAIMNNMRGF